MPRKAVQLLIRKMFSFWAMKRISIGMTHALFPARLQSDRKPKSVKMIGESSKMNFWILTRFSRNLCALWWLKMKSYWKKSTFWRSNKFNNRWKAQLIQKCYRLKLLWRIPLPQLNRILLRLTKCRANSNR